MTTHDQRLAGIKLLQVGSSWFPYQFSGLERYYAALVTRLPSLGMEVIGLVYELNEAPKVEGLELVSFGTQRKSLPRKFLDQRRIMKSYLNSDIDLVVSNCTPSLFPPLSHLGDKPLICHFQGPAIWSEPLKAPIPFRSDSRNISKARCMRGPITVLRCRYI